MKFLATVFLVLLTLSLSAQTLFYYGDDSVSVKDFLKAYSKNNTGAKTEKAFRDYLDLYINSRLKIREAKDRKYDTLPMIVADLENLRQQILPNYLNDKEGVNRLIQEALLRSKKNIHVSHIFISLSQNSIIDTQAAKMKLDLVQQQLQKNVSFTSVARQYSDDPSANVNEGDLDWVTVFTLPYALETIAYQTQVGNVSKVYRSKVGYHLLKNMGERTDPGRIKVAQILLAFQPGDDQKAKAKLKLLADSIYNRLQKGDQFGKLASKFSNDVISAAANGQMQEFGVGQYDPVFEKAAYSLFANGTISKPVLTSYGYHIIKRLGRTLPAWNANDPASMESLRNKVEQSDRMSTTNQLLAEKTLKKAGFNKAPFRDEDLWSFSDSIMNYAKSGKNNEIGYASLLFQLGDKKVTAADWINFAQTFRFKPDGSGVKPYTQVWDEFVEASALDYYKSNLEIFNEDFRQQINEFRDGNLFFEIMQREVWTPAQNDSAALANFYNNNKNKYTWQHSANAVVFYATDVSTAKTFANQLKKSPASWRELLGNYSEKITSDSGRFELKNIPNPTNLVLKPGVITSPLMNKGDQSAAFAYIIRVYDKGGFRSFSDARGLVINEYQASIEKTWLEELKKKYPVRMNNEAMIDVVKKKQW